MASITSIGIGSSPNDGTGDTLRVAGATINANFTAVNNEVVAATAALAALGDLAALDTVGATQIDNDAIDSQHYTDGSIDRAHLSADIIDGTKIENDAVGLEHLAAAAYASEAEAEAGTENTKIMTALRVAQAIAELGGGGGGGSGDMSAATYDPQAIGDDAFARANHTGTQALATISDAGDLAALDTVSGTEIDADAVDSAHIAAGAVDLEHMSANSVDSDQYVDGSIDTAHLADDAVTAAKASPNVGVRSSVEDTGDYSSTPKTVADEWGVERYFTDANDHIIAFPSGLTVGAHGWLIAPGSNTLDIRRVADSGVSIDGIAANGALSGSVGIVPAGGRRMWIVRDTNTIVTYGETAAEQALTGDLDAAGFAVKNAAGRQASDASVGTGTHTVDLDDGEVHEVTATGDFTLAFTFPNATGVFSVEVRAINWGAHTVTLTAVDYWAGGSAPTLTSSGRDDLLFEQDGNGEITGRLLGQDIS